MTDTHRPTRRRGRRVNPLFLGVCLAALLLLLLSLFLWLRHRAFLSSSSYDFVEKFLSDANGDTFLSEAEEYLSTHLTSYEERSEVEEALAELCQPQKLTFARAEEFTEKRPVYTLYAEGQAAFTLRLKQKFSLTGRPRWAVASLSVCEDNDLSRPFVLEVPHGALVTVNGTELSSSAATAAPYFALTAFEQSLGDSIFCDRYELGRFFLTPELTVLYEGTRLQATTVEDGVLRYAYPASSTFMATITVPYGAAVTVNALPIPNAYRVEAGESYPFLTRFEKDVPGITTVTVYQISGLFAEPEIAVRYNGALLAPEEGSYTYRLPEEQTKTVVIAAPSYATVKLNGVPLTEEEISVAKSEFPLFDGVVGYAKDRPYLTEYTVSGLLLDPVITAFDKNGNALSINVYDSDEGRTVINCTPDSSLPDRELLTVRTFAELLTTYLYSGANGQSQNFDNVTAMTPGDSPAYRALKAAYSSLYTADQHKRITFGELNVLSYYSYSETTYSVVVSLPFTSELNGAKYESELTLEILYIYSGSIRRVINYRILDTVTAAS